MMMTIHAEAYVRTEAGKAEIRAHNVRLSRPARNLLLVIDASLTGHEWLGKVNGSSQADLDVLVEAGLIAVRDGGPVRTVYQRISVETAVRDWTYDALYALLTQEARESFGLLKGYRLIMKIEGCADLESLQAVALEVVEQLRRSQGLPAATRFGMQLGATN